MIFKSIQDGAVFVRTIPFVSPRPPIARRWTSASPENSTMDDAALVPRPSTEGQQQGCATDDPHVFPFKKNFSIYKYTSFLTPFSHSQISVTHFFQNESRRRLVNCRRQNWTIEQIMFTLADHIHASVHEQQEQVPRPICRWNYVRREHDVTHQRLFRILLH